MRTLLIVAILLGASACGPHYTIPEAETDEIGKVVSSGRSPEGCIENLKEDAEKLRLKVKVVDIHYQSPGWLAWLWTNSYTCTGAVKGRL